MSHASHEPDLQWNHMYSSMIMSLLVAFGKLSGPHVRQGFLQWLVPLQLNETVPTICLLLEVSADAVSDACEQAWQVRILSCAVEPAVIFLHFSSLWPLGP